MFMVLGDIFASLFGGIIITIVLILTLVLLTRVLFPNTSHTPGSLIVIVISFFFFLFQSTLLVGGYKAKGYVRQLETTVSGLSGELLFDQPLQDPIQLKLAADYLSEEYPFLKGFLDDAVIKAEAQLSQHPGGTLVECHTPTRTTGGGNDSPAKGMDYGAAHTRNQHPESQCRLHGSLART